MERRRERFELNTEAVPTLLRPEGFEPQPSRWEYFGDNHRVKLETTAT